MLRILYFASNPKGLKELGLAKEFHTIRQELLTSGRGAAIEMEQVQSGTLGMLTHQIRTFKPNILHYAGHATGSTLLLEDSTRQKEELTAAQLAAIIQILGTGVRCLVLNACYTAAQATELGKYVPFFVGMQTEISTSQATRFSAHFYPELAAGDELGKAFFLAKSALGKDAAIPAPTFWPLAEALPLVQKVRIFCIYASKEQSAYRDLRVWLAVHLRAGVVELTGSDEPPADRDATAFCDEQINTAEIILCLTSPDFFADHRCTQLLAQAIRQREVRNAYVVPLLVRPSQWEDTVFEGRRPLPREGATLAGAKNRDLWWNTVVVELIAVVREAEDKLLDKRWEPCLKRLPSFRPAESGPQVANPDVIRPADRSEPMPAGFVQVGTDVSSSPPSQPRSVGFLHLSDLHQGMDAARWLWPAVRQLFFQDLKEQHKKSGPWDVVFFTGDLTQRGSREEFEKLDQTLERLRKHLQELGSTPSFLYVPGNHDLMRPTMDPSVRVLRHWHQDRELRETFLRDQNDPSRRMLANAFEPYLQWNKRQTAHLGRAVQRLDGLLPGDFSASLSYGGMRLGVVGLNSAFLQLESGDYKGRLHLDVQQLHVACGGDAMDWLDQQDVSLLLTHHPGNWLGVDAHKHFLSEVYTPGRFVAHLYGHMHEPSASALSQGGGELRRYIQAPGLFGLEEWVEGGQAGKRIHGYSAGRITLANGRGELRIWPRLLVKRQDLSVGMAPDTSFHLGEDGAMSMTFSTGSSHRG